MLISIIEHSKQVEFFIFSNNVHFQPIPITSPEAMLFHLSLVCQRLQIRIKHSVNPESLRRLWECKHIFLQIILLAVKLKEKQSLLLSRNRQILLEKGGDSPFLTYVQSFLKYVYILGQFTDSVRSNSCHFQQCSTI